MPLRRLAFCLLAPFAGATDAPPAPPAAWAEITSWRLPEAAEAFADAEAGRLSRLGRATVLLELPPKTPANLDESEAILRALVSENADDEAGLVAAWLLARLHHVHRSPADRTGAAAWYRHLRARPAANTHPLVAQASVKLALLVLYADDGRSFDERFAEALSYGEGLSEPAARRDFHLLAARACQFHGAPEASIFPHLLAALATGELGHRELGNVLYTVTDMGGRLGRVSAARDAGERFLRTYPRDERVQTVRHLLAALPASDA